MAITSLFPQQGFQSFIDESVNTLAASSTMSAGVLGGNGLFRSQVVNRASITDISQNLKPAMGIERIPVQEIYLMANEFGPNGEPVWGVVNDDRGLIRFVGGFANSLNANGMCAQNNPGSTADFVEVTFYGTGLNMLAVINAASRDFRVTVDGGTEGSSSIIPSGAIVIDGRNYPSNQVIAVASGLSLGIHTVKIRNNSVQNSYWYGFEILNENLSIKTNVGSAYVNGGKKLTLSTQDTGSYNSGFTNTFGSAGTKGGHVLIYQDVDGLIKRDIRYVDTTAQYTTSADHTNEEVVRKYNVREFGANRSDDFSTSSNISSTYVFALDDGTSALGGANLTMNSGLTTQDGVLLGSTAIYFTFVGTGVDLTNVRSSVTGAYNIFIDGTQVVSGFSSWGLGNGNVVKIASGLPYGTHVLKIVESSHATNLAIGSFIVYQPKKPALPAGAIELGDYNLMATFSANATLDASAVSSGVLRKHSTREIVYGGTWNSPSLDINSWNGIDVLTNTTTSFAQYTFMGTGFELKFETTTASSSWTITVDGSTNLSGFTTSSYGTGVSFVASTGTVTTVSGANPGGGVVVNGLTYGVHTVRLTFTSGSGMYVNVFDVITPIHSTRSNVFADFQNTLPVGSCAISDNRQITPIKQALPAQKAWAQSLGQVSGLTSSSTSFTPTDLSCTIKTNGGPIEFYFSIDSSNSASPNTNLFQVYIDGVPANTGFTANGKGASTTGSGNRVNVSDSGIFQVAPGVHKVDLYCAVSAGTLTLTQLERILKVREL